MKLATSPLKGKPRRMRVDREERLAFVRRLLTRPSEFRAVNFFIIQSIHFSISNNAIKKSPCRHFFSYNPPSLTIRIASALCKKKEVIYLFISFSYFMSLCLQTLIIIIELVKLNNSNK